MVMTKMTIGSEAEMLQLGESLGRQVPNGVFIFLSGDLGAGKTTLTKGIARGLGINETITSPTFQLKKSYQGRLALNHLDLYRLTGRSDLAVLEPETLAEQGVTVVEWGQLLQAELNPDYLEIEIEYTAEPGQRLVSLQAHGPEAQCLLGAIE